MTYDDLPNLIPIFPLEGVLLLPGGVLSMNIFEERYIHMINDVLGTHRMIGIIQLDRDSSKTKETKGVFPIGCAGRIIEWSETNDGRYSVMLKGINRFIIEDHVESVCAYRQIKPDWAVFEDDMVEDCDPFEINRDEFMPILEQYLAHHGMDCDLNIIHQSPCHTLLTTLPMICPFNTQEKQALLEAQTMDNRYEVLLTLLKISLKDNDPSCPKSCH